jgi:type IV pilus assembly protein PilA
MGKTFFTNRFSPKKFKHLLSEESKMSVSVKRRSQSGFTLVELLIVVAIIGVLSTIGIPTFRKMIQKAKKSEAKVNLGGLYTAEQAFFSEYGLYGNLIDQVGFETDGQNLIYVIGFMDASCVSVTPIPAATDTTPLAAGMLSAYPDCKTGTVTKNGNTALTSCPFPNPNVSFVHTGLPSAPNVFDETGERDGFIAYAVGVISPNVSNTAPSTLGTDVWGIDHKRKLANTQDGVGKTQ